MLECNKVEMNEIGKGREEKDVRSVLKLSRESD